jgi:diaminopimelate decarboxylase
MNQFGGSPAYARKIRPLIDGVAVDDLVTQYGSPLFVFSERQIRRRHHEVYNAFSRHYPNVQLAWSYKTNYLNAICAIMHQEGSIAEVVSEMEYSKARELGVPGDQIIFNGPYKPFPALERALREGALVQVDHLDEIGDLELVADKVADTAGQKFSVGLRLNLDAGIYPQWSRFGFNLESGEALAAVKRMVEGGRLLPRSLHCHIGTFIVDPSAYARQVQKMVYFAGQLEEQFGVVIEQLDIGGGYPSQNHLKATYLSPDVSIPSIDEYAEQIGEALTRSLRPGRFPKLVLEAGRAMIDEAGYLISTIHAVKRLPDGTRAYVADAGVNLLFTTFWYKLQIELEQEVSGMNENSVIYGPLCMNLDVIEEGAMLPPLKRGARLILSPVGAYNNTQWMQFITYRPNVVLIGEEGEVDVIRKAEDLTDLTRRERLPDRLNHRGQP